LLDTRDACRAQISRKAASDQVNYRRIIGARLPESAADAK